jgi:hypothetical protein
MMVVIRTMVGFDTREQSLASGIGAISLSTSGKKQFIYKRTTDYLSNKEPEVHAGLTVKASTVDELKINWPDMARRKSLIY